MIFRIWNLSQSNYDSTVFFKILKMTGESSIAISTPTAATTVSTPTFRLDPLRHIEQTTSSPQSQSDGSLYPKLPNTEQYCRLGIPTPISPSPTISIRPRSIFTSDSSNGHENGSFPSLPAHYWQEQNGSEESIATVTSQGIISLRLHSDIQVDITIDKGIRVLIRESSPDNDSQEINSSYVMLKNRKITESDGLGTVEAAEKSYSGNSPKNGTPRESGDHGPDEKLRSTPENKTDFESDEEIDDGCIEIHSLSSNASIALNPSAHRSSSSSSSSSSFSSYESDDNTSDSETTLADEQEKDYSIRPGTASSEVVHRAFTRMDDEKIQALQKNFQLFDNSRKIKELVEKLYLRERRETAKDKTEYYVYNVLLGRIVELLDDFALLPVPLGFQVRCRVTRRRSGMDGTLFPQYFLHLQRNGEPDVLLLTAKKHKLLSTSYVISSDPADLSSKSPHCVGILKANLRWKQFNLYTKDKSNVLDLSSESGTSTKPSTAASTMRSDNKIKEDREQLLELSYESNPLGGPRRIKVKIPKFQSDHQRVYAGSFKNKGNPLLVELANRNPVWSPQSNSFILNFRGRVQLASVKNFQIIHPDMSLHNLLQFGRVDKDTFILDFGYPFCPLQAFAIGLSSFDGKWGL